MQMLIQRESLHKCLYALKKWVCLHL